eukprot:scaffold64336_cov58-Phaeocystis_antarctica.AAC.3
MEAGAAAPRDAAAQMDAALGWTQPSASAPSKGGKSLLRVLEETMPRDRPFQYSKEEFLADVFGPEAVPKSKSPTRAPSKAWNAPPLSDAALAKAAEKSARVDASAKAKALQQQQQQQRQPPAEALTEEQQLKAYERKAATLLKAVKSARASQKGSTPQQLRRIGLGPFAESNLAKANLAKAELAAAAKAAPPPKQKRRTVPVLVPVDHEGVAAALDIERKASSRAAAAVEVRKSPSVSQSVSHYHTPSRELTAYTHTLLWCAKAGCALHGRQAHATPRYVSRPKLP